MPFLYVSALTGQRVRKVLDLILEVAEDASGGFPPRRSTRCWPSLIERNAPPQKPGEEVKLLYASQIGTAPPTLAIVSNRPDEVPESYQRYLVHGFREAWPFSGSPLRLKFTRRGVTPVTARAALLWLAAPRISWERSPPATLVSRIFAGIDLRQHGSGNLGATNLYRVLGWKYAIPVALFDIAKGVIPVLVFAPQVSSSRAVRAARAESPPSLGHVFSVFVRIQGREGCRHGGRRDVGTGPAGAGRRGGGMGAAGAAHRLRVARAALLRRRCLPLAVYLLERPDQPGAALGRSGDCGRRHLCCTAATSSGCSRAPRTGSAAGRRAPRP